MADDPRCECGRRWADCDRVVQRFSLTRWTYYTCPICRREWSYPEVVTDLAEPVSSTEIIEVHKTLADPDLTIGEITKG